MTRGPLKFKETDLVRAIKSAKKAGLQVAGYEINPKTGTIVVRVGKTDDQPETDNPWDKALS
jgi:membrane peptidoglycan carboxypeptidase